MKQGQKTRSKILDSANKLFYRQGFNRTAFSDIVLDTGLSKGNITYHFKSKDDILTEVFKQRIEKTNQGLAEFERNNSDANSRIEAFIDSLQKGKSELTRYGCPNGSLAYELGKSDGVTRNLSRNVFELIRQWLIKQFLDLDNTEQQSKSLAMELFTRGQGICVLAQVYSDDVLFETEVKRMKEDFLFK